MDYTLRVEGEFEESDQIKNIVLGTQNDKIIYLRDVANVRYPKRYYPRTND